MPAEISGFYSQCHARHSQVNWFLGSSQKHNSCSSPWKSITINTANNIRKEDPLYVLKQESGSVWNRRNWRLNNIWHKTKRLSRLEMTKIPPVSNMMTCRWQGADGAETLDENWWLSANQTANLQGKFFQHAVALTTQPPPCAAEDQCTNVFMPPHLKHCCHFITAPTMFWFSSSDPGGKCSVPTFNPLKMNLS